MLIRLQSGFHFRRGIPVRFRPALGKREIWHPLETLDRNLARTRACAMYGLTSQLFECISLAMSSSEETSSLNKAVETFPEALAVSCSAGPVPVHCPDLRQCDSGSEVLLQNHERRALLARMEDHQRASSGLEKIAPEISALTAIIHKLEKSARRTGHGLSGPSPTASDPELKKVRVLIKGFSSASFF